MCCLFVANELYNCGILASMHGEDVYMTMMMGVNTQTMSCVEQTP